MLKIITPYRINNKVYSLCVTWILLFCLIGQGSAQNHKKGTDSVVTYYGGRQSISFFLDGTYKLIQHNTDIYHPDFPVLSEGKYIRVKDYAYYLYSNPMAMQCFEFNGREEKTAAADSYQIEIIDAFRNNHPSYAIDCLVDTFVKVFDYYYDIRLYYDLSAMYNFRLENPTCDLQSMGFHELDCVVFYEEFMSYDNRIEIPKKIPVPIHKINIRIMSDSEVGGFDEYYVRDTASNSFVIEIPDSVYAKFYFYEYDGEIAEIIDDNTIGFQNHTWYKDEHVCGKKPNRSLREIWKNRYQLSDPYPENRIMLKVPRERR